MDDLTTVKRLHYFDHQFLRANDFTDEQSYHVTMRRLHNQLLHSWGIAAGLEVTFQGGATAVTVGSGVAIDGLGREIVVPADQLVELVSFAADQKVYVTVSYAEQDTDESAETGASGDTRTTEQPKFASLLNAPGDASQQIVLAVVSRTGTEVTAVDTSIRRPAGTAGGSLDVLGLSFRDPTIVSTGWVQMRLEAVNRALLDGSLHISESLDVGGNASVAGGLTASTLGWGTGSQLTTEQGGSIELGGNNNVAGSGTPFVDFHFTGKKEDYNVRLINDADHQLTITGAPVGNLRVTGDLTARSLSWGAGSQLSGDQGGSVELGGNNTVAGTGTPYIDFHFNGKSQDFNVRLINDADGQLTIAGRTRVLSDLSVAGRLYTGSLAANAGRNPTFNTGEVHVAGAGGGGWSFGNRETPEAQIFDGAAGTRWVLYSSATVARLWASGTGDRLSVNPSGDTVIAGTLGTAGWPATPHQPGWGGGLRTWDIEAEGSIWTAHSITALGGKGGYVTDQFVNNTGESLNEGDVVVLAPEQTQLKWGMRDNIPLPEVDPADQPSDTRVCGIVSQLRGDMMSKDGKKAARSRRGKKNLLDLEARRYSDTEAEEMGHAEVKPGQIGEMVTLGAFSHCNVDADIAPIEVGDLLTTSPTRGHAQKVLEPGRAIGAIVAKSLAAVPKGKAKIPVMVLLQ